MEALGVVITVYAVLFFAACAVALYVREERDDDR